MSTGLRLVLVLAAAAVCVQLAFGQATIGPLTAIRITTGVPIDPNKTPVNRPIALAHAWVEDKLLVTANYPNGAPYNFYVVEQDGGLTPWGTTSGLSDEIMIDTVPNANTAGFIPGDLFVGNGQSGQVLRLSNRGNTVVNPWCNLGLKTAGQTANGVAAPAPGAVGTLRGSVHFDRHGAWNNELIIASSNGHVYRVQAGATECAAVTYVGSSGGHLEGLWALPNDVNRWGRFAGASIHGAEGDGSAWAFWADGRAPVKIPSIGCSIEDIDEVPANGGDTYYIVNYGQNAIYAVDFTQFDGHGGKLLVTQEATGIFQLIYDPANGGTLRCVPVTINGYSGGSTEQATFSQSGVNEILPSDFSLCIDASSQAGATQSIKPVRLPRSAGTAVSNYLYNQDGTAPASARTAMVARPDANELWVYLTQDFQNQFTLHVLTGTMSAATTFDVSIATNGGALTFPLGNNLKILVQDDPSDTFNLNAATGAASATFNVAAGQTDGLVLGPIDFVSMQSLISMEIDVRVSSGSFSATKFATQFNSSFPIVKHAFGGKLTLTRVHCNCGDGKLQRGEECDDAIPGSICCNQCKFSAPTRECRPVADLCDVKEYCSGSSAQCPPDGFIPLSANVQCGVDVNNNLCSYCNGASASCPPVASNPQACPTCSQLNNCSNHGSCVVVGGVQTCVCQTGAQGYTGPTCNVPTCGTFNDCSSCSAHAECGWCCSETGGYCTAGNAQAPTDPLIVVNTTICPVWQFSSCPCASTCVNNGTCVCGSCKCGSPYGGATCSQIIDCKGVVAGPAVLGICGCDAGNTACIGCDNLPFGKRLDACGVCGGDGTSCFNPCNADTCAGCVNLAECVWCRIGESDACVSELREGECSLTAEGAEAACAAFELGLDEEAAAGIGAGIVAAIIIGVIVGLVCLGGGGYGGYKVLERYRSPVHAANVSPLYQDEGMRGVNPIAFNDDSDPTSFLKPGVSSKAEQYPHLEMQSV